MDWAAIVGWVRERQGLKQGAFANLLDVDQATVSRWECGKQIPGLSIRKKLTQILSQMEPHQDLALLDERLANQPSAVTAGGDKTLLTIVGGAKAMAERLTISLASETALADALTGRLATAERIIAESGSDGELPKTEPNRRQKPKSEPA